MCVGEWMVLRIARVALLISIVIWAKTLTFGIAKIGDPLLLYVVGVYGAIAIGVTALACVVLQFARWVTQHGTSNRTN